MINTIKTDRLILRKFSSDDLQDYFLIMNDKSVNEFLPWFPCENPKEAEKHMQNHEGITVHGYAICLKSNNRPIGYISVSNNKGNDFGYGLRKEFWHKGIVSEASIAIIEKLRDAGLPYITATHDIHNPRSGGVMKNIGMKYCYSYIEQWQPKNITVTFRMYQLNFDNMQHRIYSKYWDISQEHFVEFGI